MRTSAMFLQLVVGKHNVRKS